MYFFEPQIFSFFLLLFRATPTAYGGSHARGPVGATAAGSGKRTQLMPMRTWI